MATLLSSLFPALVADPVASTPGLRTLGTGSTQAMPGDTSIPAQASDIGAVDDSHLAGHPTQYTDLLAIAAMGVKDDANPLNHDRTTAADIRAAAGSLPVVALGTLSGATAIDWGGEGQVVTATVDNVAYEFTKGTGWPATGSADVRLHLTVTTPAAGTWTIATKVANWPTSFDAGEHILVISCLNDVITAIYSVKPEAP